MELVNFLVIGDGKWSHNYRRAISKLKNTCVLECEYSPNNEDFLESLNEQLKKVKHCIIVIVTNPILQFEVLKLLESFAHPIILEKPLCFDEATLSILRKRLILNPGMTLCGLFNLLNPQMIEFQKIYNNYKFKLKKVAIYDGSFGPHRRYLNSYFDWSPHTFATLQSVNIHLENFSIIHHCYPNGDIYEANFDIENFTIMAKFGNGFPEKKREIHIELNDGKNYEINLEKKSFKPRREMDRLVSFSTKYFFQKRFKNCKLYSRYETNDNFILRNAELTLLHSDIGY